DAVGSYSPEISTWVTEHWRLRAPAQTSAEELLEFHVKTSKKRRNPLVAKKISNKSPAVSVIVPHFNSTGFLRLTLKSFAKQKTAIPFEVIVVDDASSRPEERTAFQNIAKAYEKDRRFRFFQETINRGAGGARNFGATRAKGRYFLFFDADNEALPE